MALILDTATIDREALPEVVKFHLYNSLDACTTFELRDKLKPELTKRPCFRDQGDGEGIHDPTDPARVRYFEAETYEQSRTLNAALIDIMRSGILIDEFARGRLIDQLTRQKTKLENRLRRLLVHGLYDPDTAPKWIIGLNPNSTKDVMHLLYEEDCLALPPIKAHSGKPTVDRDALERLARYPQAKPICDLLLGLRDASKTLSDIRAPIDPDGRIRTTLSVAGTDTGRMSSYKSGRGTGRNLQNIAPHFRHIFCSDPGHKFAYIDLAQAEARAVGAIIWSLFGDPAYLDACESDGDLHTNTARLVWPELIRTREDADQLCYRNFTYRFLCKRIGHGSNYLGTPRTISAETTVPAKQIEEFQERYFAAFPGIRRWHHWIAEQLATQGFLVSLMGRKRWFMGRADDDATIREAVAYDPQETVASLLNRGLFRLWHQTKINPAYAHVRPLLQIHDAVLCSYPETANEPELIPQLQRIIETPITLRHRNETRRLLVPATAEIGWNWGAESESNRDGLVEFTGEADARKRQSDPAGDILTRPIFA